MHFRVQAGRRRIWPKRQLLPRVPLVAAATAAVWLGAVSQTSRADLNGFTDFAPINESLEGTPSPSPGSVTGNGYHDGGTRFKVTAQSGSGPVTGQAVSGFSTTKQPVTNFQARFTYVATSDGTPADGFTFALQNDLRGTAALGGRAGDLGYSGTSKITNSVASAGILYFPSSTGPRDVITEYINGENATGFVYFPRDVNLRSGSPIDVTVSYYGQSLTTSYRQLSTGRSFSRTLANVNLPSELGGASAHVGFTGGTGGFTATQNVSNFSYRAANAAFAPIAVTGFSHDFIVEAGATNAAAAVTATMDGGASKGNATFYQRGYDAARPSSGVPTQQSFTSANDPQHAFALASATGTNGLLLSSQSPAGTLTLDTPAPFSALSFLTSTGGGSGGFNVNIKFVDGATETLSGVMSPDWFNNGCAALLADGRVYDDGFIDAVGQNPRLYQSDAFLANTSGLIQSLELSYAGGTGHTVVFGVSGIPVPEPASPMAATLFGAWALRRRRHGSAQR